MVKEVEYITKYPDEANGRDVTKLQPLRSELRTLVDELSSRAGEPELMKTAAAERMRQKLERRLLPKLQVSIPKWAEQLRFMHADVLKWSRPERSPLLVEQEKAEAAAATAREQAAIRLQRQQEAESWAAPADVNPMPDDEELRVLKAMGWGCDNDDDLDIPDPVPEPVDDDPVPELEEDDQGEALTRRGSLKEPEHLLVLGNLSCPAEPIQEPEREEDESGYKIDPTNEFAASPALDRVAECGCNTPSKVAHKLYELAGGSIPW